MSSQMAAAMGSHRFILLSERESGPGNSRLNGEKGVLLAWSGTAPLALQARWLIWFQCLVLTLAWHSTLCHLLLSAWRDVAHVTSDRLRGLIETVGKVYRVNRDYITSLKLLGQLKLGHWQLHIIINIFEIGQKPPKNQRSHNISHSLSQTPYLPIPITYRVSRGHYMPLSLPYTHT